MGSQVFTETRQPFLSLYNLQISEKGRYFPISQIRQPKFMNAERPAHCLLDVNKHRISNMYKSTPNLNSPPKPAPPVTSFGPWHLYYTSCSGKNGVIPDCTLAVHKIFPVNQVSSRTHPEPRLSLSPLFLISPSSSSTTGACFHPHPPGSVNQSVF